MAVAELLVKILGDGSQLEGAFGKVKGVVEENKSKFESWSGSVGKASLIAGGAITGVGAVALKIGEPIEKAHVTLEQAIKNTGGSFEEFHGQIDKTIGKMAGLGHGSADTQTALEKLTVATNDPKKALDEMALVSEIAAQKHISLADAAGMVVKQLAGGAKLAKEFGINAKDAAAATKELEAATKADDAAMRALMPAQETTNALEEKLATKYGMSKTVALQVAAAHKTVNDARASGDPSKLVDAEGQLGSVLYKATAGLKMNATDSDTLSKARYNLQEKSSTLEAADTRLAKAKDTVAASTKKGSVEEQEMAKLHGIAEAQANTFGGKLAALRTHIENVAGTMASKWAPAMVQAGPLILGLGTIMESGLIPAIGGAIASTWAFTAALLANPITWIVLGIVALAAVVYEIVTHWSAVTKFIGEFWSTVKGLVGEGISAVLGFFARLPGEVWGFVSDMGAKVLGFLAGLPAQLAYWAGYAIGEYVRFWLDLPGRIWGVLMDVLHFLEDFVPKAISWAIRVGVETVERIIGFYTSLPGRVWDLLVGGAGLLGKMADAIPGLAAKALEMSGQIGSGILHFIADLPGHAGDVVSALVKLLKDAAVDVGKAALNLGGSIVSGFLHGLGKSSPSFLERAMVEIVGGVKGHVDTLGSLVGGVNGMAVAPSLSAVPSLVSAYPAGAATIGGGAGSVTVHSHLWLDGKEIADSVTTYQIQAGRRNVTTSAGVI